ncbi:unnamed protein product [Ostreobium quekettii]|uniref:CREG-like beta-barrel domain-containing protein n=1 Tax=Ostreobium quekettii TaxID=121088 RepID=A0A8S1IU35_9CHLO|nr:unnamed protein product [Ostreobium quekettii]|eukprot:evm.model.scf_1698EXC.3 EVM.evm.TU.scf_1698EXC.3   scf_1698EXC:29763-35350(-)
MGARVFSPRLGRCAPARAGEPRGGPAPAGGASGGARRNVRLQCARVDGPEADGVHKDRATAATSAPGPAQPVASPVKTGPVKTYSLRSGALACGVKTATTKFDLPPPQLAARNLVEAAESAQLCTIMSNMHHRRAGCPFGTQVTFATDGAGYPVIRLSPLAIPTRNILENPICSLVVHMPGWTGLSNARVTLFGDVYPLPPSMHPAARELFQTSSSGQDKYVTGNTLYFRMHRIKDIFFVGGFGTVQWIDVADYVSCKPDDIVMNSNQDMLHVLNESCKEELQIMFSSDDTLVEDATVIAVDAIGADVRIRSGPNFGVLRMGFDVKVRSISEAIQAVKRAALETTQ